MAQYIDKPALVAEINKRIMDAPIDCYGHQRVWAYNDIKDILDTLEVKNERAGTEDILNELASRIKSAEIVNVRQVLEWINEQTKE